MPTSKKPSWDDTIDDAPPKPGKAPSWDDSDEPSQEVMKTVAPRSQGNREDPEAELTRAASVKHDATAPGFLESFRRGVVQGGLRDSGDEAVAMMAEGPYRQNLMRERDKNRRAEAENPKMYMAGDLTGAIGTLPAAITSLPALLGVGAAEGAARSIGKQESLELKDAKRTAGDAAGGAAASALFGKAGTFLANKAGEGRKAVYGYLRNKAGEEAGRSLRGTKEMYKRLVKEPAGQRRLYPDSENKLQDMGKMALDEKIVTPFASNKTMLDRTDNFIDDIDTKISPIYDMTSSSTISKKELQEKILGEQMRLMTRPETVPIAGQMERYAKNVEDASLKKYNPADIRKFRQGAQDNVNFNTDAVSQRGSRRMGELARETEFDLISKKSPWLAQQNEKYFRQTHLGLKAKEMAEKGAAANLSNQKFGLGATIAGGSALAGSASMDNSALWTAGLTAAAVGLTEVAKRYSRQMTATGLNRVAKIVANPSYSRMFEAASKRSPQAVGALHSALMRNDPNYKAEFETAINSQEGEE